MSAAASDRQEPAPLWGVVEESLDEAELLWRRWQVVLSTHAYGLEGVSFWVEDRLLGAIDGLLLAGEAALGPLLLPALLSENQFRSAVATHVIAAGGSPQGIRSVVAAFKKARGERLQALEHGLESVRGKAMFAAIDDALVGADVEHQASGLRMRAFQQRDPGPQLPEALESGHPGLQASALRALRHTTGLGAAVAVERLLGTDDPIVRDAAIEAGLVRGISAAWRRCRELAAAPAPDAGRPLLLVGMLGLPEDHETLLRAVENETVRDEAVFALGFAGTVAAAARCIELLAAGLCPQLAGEALAAITGLDLVDERLVTRRPKVEPEEPIPFEEEDLDADLVPKPADLLPWPDVGGVIRWWNENRNRFVDGQRYLGGKPVDLNVLQGGMVEGPMRRRPAVALELAIRTGGRYQVETRALTSLQKRQMQVFDLLGGSSIRRSRLKDSFSVA